MTSARQDALSAERMMTSGMETSSRTIDPDPRQPLDAAAQQDAIYSRMLMAAMAGRRTMVLTDYTGGNGAMLGRRMADYMVSSGGMALTATAHRGAGLEDLLAEAAAKLGLRRSGNLEELALSLERSLDAAGSGLLVIFDAHLLSAPVISDLCELSGSDTESGLYMQVLLTGGPALDAQFDKPGLVNAARQVASSRWRIEGEEPAQEQPAAIPVHPVLQPQAEPAPAPVRQAAKEQAAFVRRRTQRLGQNPAPEPRPLRKVPAKAPAAKVYAAVHTTDARPSRRKYWAIPAVILFAFGAGFVTNALWPFAPKSATELLTGDGSSALIADLPKAAPPQPQPATPEVQPEPDPVPPAPAPEPPAAAAPPPAAAALPPEWNQPVERPRAPSARSAPAVAATQPAERPVATPPTPLTPQPQQQAQLPPQQAQLPPQQAPKAAGPADVCREGAGARKPPQDSLSGIAEGFMTDLRNLGRCLNSLTR